MAWEKVPPELRAFLEEKAGRLDCVQRQMFGSPAFFVNGNMFAAAHQHSLVLRLPEDAREEFLAAYDEAGQFEPMAGRPMREYVSVPESAMPGHEFDGWLGRSHEWVSAMPEKKPKPKQKR
jgi:TfoX/Sxy family transcriptional regulator of competence genes